MFNKLEQSDRQVYFGLSKRQPQRGSNYFLPDTIKEDCGLVLIKET